MAEQERIGLALSGGGSRAVAFHLGCLRALHDRGILPRIAVLSSVSGGSVIAALYAYFDEPFEDFERRVVKVLRKGFVWGIARQTLLSMETPKILATVLTAGVLAHLGVLLSLVFRVATLFGLNATRADQLSKAVQAPLRRWASRTTAFERHLRTIYGDTTLPEVKREGLDVVINAAELRTATAFRFGSRATSCWRFGVVEGPSLRVSKAVAASAAYPLLLPAFDDVCTFKGREGVKRERVIITDGGIYDNHGITCLVPGQMPAFSANVSAVDFIIACDAGQGQPTGAGIPYTWGGRLQAVFSTTHRRTQSMSQNLLHRLADTGELKGFVLPYLGQLDEKVPNAPADLVSRAEVFDYPTDFNPMKQADIDCLSRRGEQLTHALLAAYHPDL